MKKFHLSQEREYNLPLYNSQQVSIILNTKYGGDKSETVPFGFVTEYVVERKLTKRQRKNKRYHANKNTTKASNRVSLGAKSVER